MSGRLRDGKKDTKDTKDMKEPQQETVYLPPLSVYTEWMALYPNQKGKRTAVLPDYTAQDLHAGKAYSTAKEYCTFSDAAGQIANRLQETDGEEKQFLVFQTEGAEADGMVPEILRAVLDADGKRAHLVTPFLEQLLFCGRSGYLVAGALTRGCMEMPGQAGKRCVPLSGRRPPRRMPGAGSGPKAFYRSGRYM